jgi:hypothetical protein
VSSYEVVQQRPNFTALDNLLQYVESEDSVQLGAVRDSWVMLAGQVEAMEGDSLCYSQILYRCGVLYQWCWNVLGEVGSHQKAKDSWIEGSRLPAVRGTVTDLRCRCNLALTYANYFRFERDRRLVDAALALISECVQLGRFVAAAKDLALF